MPQFDNTNRFSLFKNDRREKDTHPEYTGTLNVDGREFWVSAWVKEGQKGKFFSGSIKPKEALREAIDAPKPTITSGKKRGFGDAPYADPLDDGGDPVPF